MSNIISRLEDQLRAARKENESLRAECGIRQIEGYNKGKAEVQRDAERWQAVRYAQDDDLFRMLRAEHAVDQMDKIVDDYLVQREKENDLRIYSDGRAMSYQFRGMYVPDRMMDGIRLYIERGILPGGFLESVICNDLKGACGHADDENLPNIPAFVSYFYNNAPAPCWGSPERMRSWMQKFEETA